MCSLAGKVVIVTGASTGIGESICRALAKEGAYVGLAARSGQKLNILKEQIVAEGGKACAVVTDVTDRKACRNLADLVEKELGAVDILVNNAGLSVWEYMKNGHQDSWDAMIDVNIRGTLNMIAAVLPGMVERDKGHVVNMSSVRGVVAGPGGAVYSGTKFFVEGMSSGLRQEMAGKGVRVSTIQPGLVDTPLVTNNLENPVDMEALQDRKDKMDGVEILQPEDVARATIFVLKTPETYNINSLPVTAVKQNFA